MALTTGGGRLENKEMNPQIHLTMDENLALARILVLQTERAKHTISLPYMMDKWSRFVAKVENGYQLTVDDYTNSLSVRDLIQEVLNVCPKNGDLQRWIMECDNRFIAVTKVTKKPLLLPLNDESLGWWWFRVPENPGNILKEWLKSERNG
jgi:hypothetical protein